MIVAPDAKLGVVVLMASNQSSSDIVGKVGERVLLAALVDKGMLAAIPAKLTQNPLLVISPTDEEKNACRGFCFYASSSTLYRLSFAADGSITVESYRGCTWTPTYAVFKKRSAGWYAADGDSITALRFLAASGHRYIELRKLSGAEHYTTSESGPVKEKGQVSSRRIHYSENLFHISIASPYLPVRIGYCHYEIIKRSAK